MARDPGTPPWQVRNHFHDLPDDLVDTIHNMVVRSQHGTVTRELLENVGHFSSSCNPEMSFVRLGHLDKTTRYSYFKPTATLMIVDITQSAFGKLARCLL